MCIFRVMLRDYISNLKTNLMEANCMLITVNNFLVLTVCRYADNHNQIVADFLISQLREWFDEQESDIKNPDQVEILPSYC